jgi:sulfite reductase alpha subunit-like flavoprotein
VTPDQKVDKEEAAPSTVPIPINDSYSADLVANDRITAADHFQDVRLLDFRLDRNYSYGPGAVAVVYPKNFPEDVDEFIKLMHWEDVADTSIEIVMSRSSAAGQATTPSPLRHLDLESTDLTLRWLLENVLDIMSIPRRSFFANLAYFAGCSNEDEEFQKERLLELANPELIDELWDYTTRPKRTILEVMMDFTTIQIPWQYALSALPLMRGRQFSIASGGDFKQDAEGRTRVQLLVAMADPPSPIIKWRRRYGVCTRYIATLQPGQKINIGMQQGYLDVQPSELEAPVVMIGPGTGVAPMRAMAQQRHAWSKERTNEDSGKHLENDMLVFGCRGANTDYFFRDEWAQLSRTEGLQVWTAFSRDKDEPRSYVQDQIRQHAGTVYRAIHELNGRIYVCGSSGNMPKGVREAFLDVLVEQSASTSREEAEAYLDGMEKAGRYKQETW